MSNLKFIQCGLLQDPLILTLDDDYDIVISGIVQFGGEKGIDDSKVKKGDILVEFLDDGMYSFYFFLSGEEIIPLTRDDEDMAQLIDFLLKKFKEFIKNLNG